MIQGLIDDTIHVLIKPPSKIISTHILETKREYLDLLKEAKSKKYLIYYAKYTVHDGEYTTEQPLLLDWESFKNINPNTKLQSHDKPQDTPQDNQGSEDPEPKEIKGKPKEKTGDISEKEMRCPHCDQKFSSTSGRTLHIKSKHPEKTLTLSGTLQQSQKEPKEKPNKITCPYCNKKLSSASGRTLHIKNKHPEKCQPLN
jgi:Zn finger protein HypA/HybF involved in hydrogenase expression